MASKDRWWDHDEDGPSAGAGDSKKSVEEMIDEAAKERLRRQEELAEAEHDYKVAQFKHKTEELVPGGVTKGGTAEVKIRAIRDMYRTEGSINGKPVTFLVDTGASFVSMETEQVEYIGAKTGKVQWLNTANGKSKGYEVPLDEVRVGGIVVRNVMGNSSDGMSMGGDILLGMSFLNEIEMNIDDDVMTLTQTGSERTIQEEKKGSGDGVMGLWWLSPGEAVAIGLAAMITLFFFGMGALVMDSEAVYNTTSGVVLEDTSWFEESFEYESCLYDEEWDEYYDCYWEVGYECSANVKYFFDVNGTEFRSQDGLFLGEWSDPCREYVMNVELPVGSAVTVWYNPENPEDSMLEPPSDGGWIIFFCCGPFFLLILVVTLVNARFSNGPKTGWGSDLGIEFNSGGGYHRGPHYGQGGGYWGPRFGPRFRRRARHRRVRTSRRRSSGGRRSARRSSGGRRSARRRR